MSERTRDLVVYRLVISGLPEHLTYVDFLHQIVAVTPEDRKYVKNGSKYHAIDACSVFADRAEIRFTSYREGSRPDVLNTETHTIQSNPLPLNLESVEYTHAICWKEGKHNLLILERNAQGVWPGTIIRLIERTSRKYRSALFPDKYPDEKNIVVNIEAVAGPTFQEKVNSLKRITRATLRIVKPNPCWQDLKTELGDLSAKSDAGMVEVTSVAPRGKGLARRSGIVKFIQDLFAKKELDKAIIEGKTEEKESKRYTTIEEGVKETVSVHVEGNGQVDSSSIFAKMEAMRALEWLKSE